MIRLSSDTRRLCRLVLSAYVEMARFHPERFPVAVRLQLAAALTELELSGVLEEMGSVLVPTDLAWVAPPACPEPAAAPKGSAPP